MREEHKFHRVRKARNTSGAVKVPPTARDDDPVRGSQEPLLRKAEYVGPGKYKVINQTHVDQCQCIADAHRDQLIGLTSIFHPRRMIVIHDARSRALEQRKLHDFAWMDAGTINGPAK